MNEYHMFTFPVLNRFMMSKNYISSCKYIVSWYQRTSATILSYRQISHRTLPDLF
jgi:hypothetical protein